MTFIGRWPSLEDDLQWEGDLGWKTTFGERWSLVEDDLWWKMTFGGRQPSVEDELLWKTTFGGRHPLVEDDLRKKTTFCGRRPLLEDDLWRKTTFVGRQPSEDLACYLLRFAAFLNNNLLPSSTELAGYNLRVLLTTCNSFGNCRCWEIWSAPLQKMVIKLSRDGHPPSPKWFPPSQECSPTIPRTITINCHDGHPLCQGLTHNIPKMVTH